MEAADSISINIVLFVQVLIERGDIYLITKSKTCDFIAKFEFKREILFSSKSLK